MFNKRKNGEWIIKELGTQWHCSECKAVPVTKIIFYNKLEFTWVSEAQYLPKIFKYCPNCGSKMTKANCSEIEWFKRREEAQNVENSSTTAT